jgi:uncharacterized protein YpmS
MERNKETKMNTWKITWIMIVLIATGIVANVVIHAASDVAGQLHSNTTDVNNVIDEAGSK